ncbi:MAG TPA: MFS transporter [Pseudonocardiaceae bacterium]|nr:MFS transporter [Pseudonocardiaceae bacterium]
MTTISALSPPEAPAAGRQRSWLILIVLLAGQFMALLDVTIVNVAMPSVQRDLHASGAALQLVVAGYTVSYAMCLITGARLGDLYGRRRVFLIGVTLFTTSSLVCGLAPVAAVLVVARLAQGVGAALMVPQVMSTIQTRFTGQARARALSAYAAVLAIGAVCGLVLGGVLVSADLFGIGWRSVFFVNVPIGVAVIALVPALVPADRPAGTRKLDLVGLAVSVTAVCLIVLPLVLGHQDGWPAWTFACLAAGVLLAVVFVVVERRTEHPLMNVSVLRVPGVVSGLVTLAAGMIAYGGFLFAVSLHLQAGIGDSALRAGLTFAPAAAGFGLAGYHWRRLPTRWHHALPTVGYVVGGAGYLAAAAVLGTRHDSSVLIAACLLLFGIGMGGAFAPLMTHLLVNVPPASAADASGLTTTTVQLGQVLGVAVFGSLFLTLAGHPAPHASAAAIATTLGWVALLSGLGAVASLALARTVWRARAVAG